MNDARIACPACGRANRPDRTRCWECAASLGESHAAATVDPIGVSDEYQALAVTHEPETPSFSIKIAPTNPQEMAERIRNIERSEARNQALKGAGLIAAGVVAFVLFEQVVRSGAGTGAGLEYCGLALVGAGLRKLILGLRAFNAM